MKKLEKYSKWLRNKFRFLKWRFLSVSLAFKFYLYNSFVTNIPNHRFRIFYLKFFLSIKIGKQTAIHMGCFFTGNNIFFGDNSVANRNCYFDSRIGQIEIGKNVSISPEVYILTMTHLVNSPMFEAISKDVIIKDYVWIGTRAMIMPGVTLCKGSVVGAMSVALKNTDEYSINVGVPTKNIGNRTQDLRYSINYFPYFNTDIC